MLEIISAKCRNQFGSSSSASLPSSHSRCKTSGENEKDSTGIAPATGIIELHVEEYEGWNQPAGSYCG